MRAMHGKKRKESLFTIAYTLFFLIKSNDEVAQKKKAMTKIFETSIWEDSNSTKTYKVAGGHHRNQNEKLN